VVSFRAPSRSNSRRHVHARGRPSRRRRQRLRRRSTAPGLALQPLQRRQRRPHSDTGRRSRYSTSSPAVAPTATSTSADDLGSRTRPAGRRSTLHSPATATSNWNRSSRLTVAAALTLRSSPSPNKVSQTRRYLTQRTPSSSISTCRTRAAATHSSTSLQLPHSAKYVCSEHSLNLICSLSRKFLSHVR